MKFILLCLLTLVVHPIHISVTDIEYNSNNKSLEITHKIFLDDLEKKLESKHGEKMHIGTEKENIYFEKYLKEYIYEVFVLKVNGKEVYPDFIGRESDLEAIWVYFEVKNVKKVKSLNFLNKILLDIYDDQSNIVHVDYLEANKTFRLTGTKYEQKVKL